jgi:hypothetical protein
MTSEPADAFAPPTGEAHNEEAPKAEKRRCSQLNKKGDPCKAWALKGDELGRCPAHAGVALKNLDPVAAQQASAESRRERVEARKMSVLDWTARKLEERAEEIVEAYLRAGQQGDWRALDALVNRVYGKPTERLVTEPPKPRWEQEMDELSLEELEALRAKYRTEPRKPVEPDPDPRPKETGTPEDFAWKARRKARLRAVEEKAV